MSNYRIIKELRHKSKEEAIPLIFRDLFSRAASCIYDLRELLKQTLRDHDGTCKSSLENTEECDCGARAWNTKVNDILEYIG